MEIIRWLEEAEAQRTLFSDENSVVTYGDFRTKAKNIASALISRLHVTRKPIVIFIDRNVQSICAIFGVIYSGNFYVPVDPSQPVDRIRAMFEQIRPLTVIEMNASDEVKAAAADFCTILSYDLLASGNYDENALRKVQEQALDDDPLVAICTSGSTGVPKAVVKSHRGVIDFIPQFVKTFGFSSDEVFGNQAPFDFDVSAKDIYSTIYCHARMHVIPKSCFVMPKKLIDCLNEQKVSTIIWSVSAVCIPSCFNAFKYDIPHSLRNVLFSGEQMPMKQMNIWRRYMPQVRYVNLYGPTEMMGNCMYYVLDREFADTEVLPLGKVFTNQEVLILDDNGKRIEQGEMGEICIRGSILALGYYRDPERTAQVFRQNPEHNDYPDRIYHTGDLAVLNERGEYVFASRKDFQIKHMGHRIELGEIDTYASAIENMRRVCCVFDTARNKIVLFYDGPIEKTEVIVELKKKLPKYMIPNVFVKLENMPLNKNGKIDRNALKEMLNDVR